MKKAILIGWKDLRIAFRDRAALVLMLAAPFFLTLAMGLVTGRFSGGGDSGIQGIPVVVVDEDGGQLARSLVDVLASDDLATLLDTEESGDVMAARERLLADEVAAVVIVPAGFTDSIVPSGTGGEVGETLQIELYANPARPVSSGVVRSIVSGFLGQVEIGVVGGQVAVTQLLNHGLIAPGDAVVVGREAGQAAAAERGNILIGLSDLFEEAEETAEDEQIDLLAFLAPGMAVMFLMYTVSYGGRSLLTERDVGTLPRLLTTPTRMSQVLGGKSVGIYITGLAQMLILVGATSLLFGLNWGAPLAVLVLVIATVFGASGWGILLASVANTPGQVASVGTAMMLMFGILGGSFVDATLFPEWLQALRLLTPNAWALDGIADLARGGDLSDIGLNLIALLLMGLVLFGIAVMVFRRRGVLDRG